MILREANALTAKQQALANDHYALFRRLVGELSRMFPSINRDDMAGAGHAALVGAAGTYDPSRGVPFAVHAATRMKGEMTDFGLKASKDPAARVRKRFCEAMGDVFQTVADPAGALEASEEQDSQQLRAGSDVAAAAMFAAFVGLRAVDDQNPEEELLRREALAALARARATLPEEQRRLLELKYDEDRTLLTASEELKLAYRTGKRRHAEALLALARALADPESDTDSEP